MCQSKDTDTNYHQLDKGTATREFSILDIIAYREEGCVRARIRKQIIISWIKGQPLESSLSWI
jgi:hypothetical protein